MNAEEMLIESTRNHGFVLREVYEIEESRRQSISRLMRQRIGLPNEEAIVDRILREASKEEVPQEDDHDKFNMIEFESDIDRAPDSFERLVHPQTTEEFFTEQYLDRRPKLFHGPTTRYSSLFRWEDLTALMRSGHLNPAQLRLAVNGRTIDINSVMRGPFALGPKRLRPERQVNQIDERSLMGFLRNGATLIINAIGSFHPELNDLIANIGRDLAATATANLYVSWRNTRGFITHWDGHDVFALQLQGQKIWSIFGEGRHAPMDWDVESNLVPPGKPLWKGLVRQGDLLYIPRGWFHNAEVPEECDGEGSVHITFQLQQFTGHDVLSWWSSKLAALSERYRCEVPLYTDAATTEEYFVKLKQMLTTNLNETDFQDFVRAVRSEWRDQTNLQLNQHIDPWLDSNWESVVISLRGSENAMLENGQSDGSFQLVADGFTHRFDERCQPLIELLVRQNPTVQEIKENQSSTFSPTFIDKFLRYLLFKDILYVQQPRDSQKLC